MAFKRTTKGTAGIGTPEELFRDLRNRTVQGLLAHQADLLRMYATDAEQAPDVAIQSPTGSGKTLVGLLIGEWRRRRYRHRVTYLCPTRQLAHQVAEQASAYGIRAIALTGRRSAYPPGPKGDVLSGDALAVTTYSSLFNVNSFFSGSATLICDDAHAAEDYVVKYWSIVLTKGQHRQAFDAFVGLIGPTLSPSDHARLRTDAKSSWDRDWVDKLPTPSFAALIPDIVGLLDEYLRDSDQRYSWSVVRDSLHACQLYISSAAILIRPLIPPTWTHRPFAEAGQRVYMSATLGEGGELERIWGRHPIRRLSLDGWDRQGIGRRLFFFPERSLGPDASEEVVLEMVSRVPRALALVPDERAAISLRAKVSAATGYTTFDARQLEESKRPFVETTSAVAVVANRYDGIDLVGDECRLLIAQGLPQVVNLQERFMVSRMGANALLTERILTRITQAVGRCTRSATDYSAVVVLGEAFSKFLMRPEHRSLLHPEIQAEVAFGLDQARDAKREDIMENFGIFLEHGIEWDEADGDIVALRADMSREIPPATSKLRGAVGAEVRFQQALWNADFEGAIEWSRRVLTHLDGAEVAGYRAFWNYLAGGTAWLAFERGAATMEAVAREHFERASKSVSGVRWLFDLLRFGQDADGLPSDDRLLTALIEGLELQIEQLGSATSQKLEAELKFISDNLARDDAKSFEAAHERLGRLLGYESGNDDGNAAPDPWWCVAGELCLVFEDHTDTAGTNPLGANKVRQAASHPAWIRTKLTLSPGAEIVPVLVTPCSSIEDGAKPHVGELCYWQTGEFRQWVVGALGVVRTLWRTFPGPGDLAWRAEAMSAYRAAKLDPESFVATLKGRRLSDLPVGG